MPPRILSQTPKEPLPLPTHISFHFHFAQLAIPNQQIWNLFFLISRSFFQVSESVRLQRRGEGWSYFSRIWQQHQARPGRLWGAKGILCSYVQHSSRKSGAERRAMSLTLPPHHRNAITVKCALIIVMYGGVIAAGCWPKLKKFFNLSHIRIITFRYY